jgi:hypothetical protein
MYRYLGPWDLILNHLDARDLVYLAAANRDTRVVVTNFKTRAFKVEKILSKFFSYEQIQQFRAMQRQTGTVISGSAALQFFHRIVWPATDLDLYVEKSQVAHCTSFIASCGYLLEASRDSEDCDYDLASIQTVEDFTKGPFRVQVIATRSSVMTTILGFHSSATKFPRCLHLVLIKHAQLPS